MRTRTLINKLTAIGTATLALATAVLLASTPAQAANSEKQTSSLQERVDAVLERFPGGTRTGVNEISWEGGDVVLTLEVPGATPRAIGTCADDSYCAYSGTNLTGSKISFSSCGTYSTSPVGTVRSIANARTSGKVQGKNASNTVLSTVYAGKADNSTPNGISKLACS